MTSKKGFALIGLLIAIVVIGILFYMYGGKIGLSVPRVAVSPGTSTSTPSAPKRIVDKAKAAAQKASDRQADADQQLKDLGY